MRYKYLKNAKYYLSLLEHGKSHVLLNHLQKQAKTALHEDLRLLNEWIKDAESTNLESIYHSIESNLIGRLKQVANFIDGFLTLPDHHLAQVGVTTDSHRYSQEYYEDSY